MTTTTLLVQGSSDVYHMECTVHDDGRVTLKCPCAAGRYGGWCKHKAGVLAGDVTLLANPDQAGDLEAVSKSFVERGLTPIYTAWKEAKERAEAAEKAVKKARAVLEKALNGGI